MGKYVKTFEQFHEMNEAEETFNREDYDIVKQDRKMFNNLKGASHKNIVKYLFGGSLESGDIIEHPDGDIRMVTDPTGSRGKKLNSNGKWAKKPTQFYGLNQYHKLVKK